MRQYRGTVDGHYYQIDYPERIAFAYNYNAIVFSSNDDSAFKYSITVQDEDGYNEARTIEVASYHRKAQADISLLFQLLFNTRDMLERIKKANVTIKRGEYTIFTFSCMVLYSAMNIGDRLQNYGIFPNPDSMHYERHITWFAHFPFELSYLAIEGAKIFTRYDNNPYGSPTTITPVTEGIREAIIDGESVKDKFVLKIVMDENHPSTFDDSFDYTFFRLGRQDSLIVCERSDARCGYYFRWIDKRGFWMQYLFDKGTVEDKTELGEENKEYFDEINGIQFNSQRAISIDTTHTLRCCATNLDKERYEDVAGIASACYVDLFLGYTDLGEPIWLPCNVSSGAHLRNEQKELNDFEISVDFKETTQRL